jgi:hypothetical protein
MGGPLALDGRRLMGGHNNQPKVGIDGVSNSSALSVPKTSKAVAARKK